jgi:hypothetical protein
VPAAGAARGRDATPDAERPAPQPRQAAATLPAAPEVAQPAPRPDPTVATDLIAQVDPDGKANALWKPDRWGNGSSVKRRGGKLVFFGTGDKWGGAVVASRRGAEFDFFASPVTVTADGISFRGEALKGEQQVLRLAFCAEQKTAYAARDAVNFSFYGDGRVTVGYKLGEPTKDAELVFKLLDTHVTGDITGFTVVLDGRGYHLEVVHRDGFGKAAVTPYDGLFTLKGPGLKREAWGAPAGRRTGGNGNSSLSLAGQQLQAQPSNTVTIEVGSLTAIREKAPSNEKPAGAR